MPENIPTHLDIFSGIPSGASASPPSGPASAQSPSVRSIHTAAPSCESIGQKSRTTATSEPQTSQQLDMSICLPEVPHVSRFPLQDEEKEREMIGISGRQCLALSDVSGPIGSLSKMLLTQRTWFSPHGRMIWSNVAMNRRGSIFRLALLDYQPWNGISGLLPRVEASSWKGAAKNAYRGSLTHSSASGGRLIMALREQVDCGIYPTPELCEAVKGFPASWTALEASETPSRRKSPTKSCGQSGA